MMYLYIAIALLVGLLLGKALFGKKAAPAPAPAPVAAVPAAPQEDEDEIACHRKAQQITDHVFSHICGFIRPGLTELDVSREIGVMLTQLGSDPPY